MEYRSLENADLNAGLFAANGAGGSPTWLTKTPQEILEDVNAALKVCAEPAGQEWSSLANGGVPINGGFIPPSELLIPQWSFWWMKRPTIEMFLRSRKTRRPKRFTRRIGK